jgi:hypothetical protein
MKSITSIQSTREGRFKTIDVRQADDTLMSVKYTFLRVLVCIYKPVITLGRGWGWGGFGLGGKMLMHKPPFRYNGHKTIHLKVRAIHGNFVLARKSSIIIPARKKESEANI